MKRTLSMCFLPSLLTGLVSLILLPLIGCGLVPDGDFTSGGYAYIANIRSYSKGFAEYTIRSGLNGGGLSCKIVLPNDFGKVNERVIVISTNGMRAIVAVASTIKVENESK